VTESTYLFFHGGRCALAGEAIGKVADFDSQKSGKSITLDQLGLPPSTQDTPVRVLFLSGTPSPLGLVVRGTIETRAVADKDIIPLPPAFFATSAFSALVRQREQPFALLLAARGLIAWV